MLNPRTTLATHEVANQPRPPGDLELLNDPAVFEPLSAAFQHISKMTKEDVATTHLDHLRNFAQTVGTAEARDLGRQANETPPKLTAFNPQGERIDEIEFHPAYHRLMTMGLEAGVASRAWTHPFAGQTAHAALLYLMSWADTGVTCPMSMTYASAPLLTETAATRAFHKKATTPAYDESVQPVAGKRAATIGMAMTEKQGGSDLRGNTTRAHAISDTEAELVGHKWFCSAPMCDAFLTLAYEDQGLSCFLAPRWRPDGSRNAIEIQRLKDKMGDRSNASSEIEYRGAYATRIGAPGRGIATIIQMAHRTRFDCIIGSAAGIRQAVCRAALHVSQRTVFQKKLIDQPLMRVVIADLALESEAAIALMMRVASSFDLAASDTREAALNRVLTPIAKFWICKRQPSVVAEALECLGGVGFVEESGLPRLFRTSPLNAIWEGSGNIMALDVERALTDAATRAAFNDELSQIAEAIPETAALAQSLRDKQMGNRRRFIDQAALVFSAASLPEGPLRRAYVATRIQTPGLSWGSHDFDAEASYLFDRAAGWMSV